MSRVLALSLLWLAFTASAPSSSASGGQDKLEALAAMGKIQENAPVKAASEITIKAPKEKIWQILTSIDDWPSWQSTTSAAHLNGQLAPGSTFTWKSGGAEIRSRIAFEEREIGLKTQSHLRRIAAFQQRIDFQRRQSVAIKSDNVRPLEPENVPPHFRTSSEPLRFVPEKLSSR